MKIIKIVAPIVVLAASAGGFIALNKTAPEPAKEVVEERPVSLFVESVNKQNVALDVRTQGEVTAKTQINLVPQVSGRIVAVADNFGKGASFGKDETIIQIDDADYRLNLINAEARVEDAKLKLALAEADHNVAKRNWDEKVGGKASALALKIPQLNYAKAALKSAEADLERAKLNLERTKITVPFNGRIVEKMVDIGQYVTPGTPIAKVFATDTVEVRLPLTDKQLDSIGLPIAYEAAAGTGPRVLFSAQVAGEERQWFGEIVRIEASVDAKARMFYAVAQVNDPYGQNASGTMPMAVGLFVNAEISGERVADALVMPRKALRGHNQVYVVTSAGELAIRTVDVVYTDRDRLIVGDGVEAGDQVVVSAVRAARNGMKVTAINQKQANASLQLGQ